MPVRPVRDPGMPDDLSGALKAGVMKYCVRFRFRADGSQIRKVLRRAVARFARQISSEDAGTLELTLAEVLNNIVEHAYADLPPGPVVLSLHRQGCSIACQVEDEGHPMPGLQLPEGRMQEVASDIMDLAEGGWGWALIRAMTADLHYERLEDTNRLTFQVPLAGAAWPQPEAKDRGIASRD